MYFEFCRQVYVTNFHLNCKDFTTCIRKFRFDDQDKDT